MPRKPLGKKEVPQMPPMPEAPGQPTTPEAPGQEEQKEGVKVLEREINLTLINDKLNQVTELCFLLNEKIEKIAIASEIEL